MKSEYMIRRTIGRLYDDGSIYDKMILGDLKGTIENVIERDLPWYREYRMPDDDALTESITTYRLMLTDQRDIWVAVSELYRQMTTGGTIRRTPRYKCGGTVVFIDSHDEEAYYNAQISVMTAKEASLDLLAMANKIGDIAKHIADDSYLATTMHSTTNAGDDII